MQLTHTGTVTLETPRLTLRRFVPEDAPAMYKNWASDPEVTRHLTWPPHPDVEESERVIGIWVKGYDKPSTYHWAMEDRDCGEVIGSIGAVGMNGDYFSCEIGYCLSRYYWGRGLMPEALSAIISHLFGAVGMERIFAKHSVHNPNSGRVMEKAGMTHEGVMRHAMRSRGIFIDMAQCAIIREDWERQNDR